MKKGKSQKERNNFSPDGPTWRTFLTSLIDFPEGITAAMGTGIRCFSSGLEPAPGRCDPLARRRAAAGSVALF